VTRAELDGLSAPSYARLARLGPVGSCAVCGRLAVGVPGDPRPVHDPCVRGGVAYRAPTLDELLEATR
jgi:hypothetical protein